MPQYKRRITVIRCDLTVPVEENPGCRVVGLALMPSVDYRNKKTNTKGRPVGLASPPAATVDMLG